MSEEKEETAVAKTEPTKLPTIAELTGDAPIAYKAEQFNAIMSMNPPEQWVKVHPYIKDHKYLPIDKVEHLLRKVFKRYRIEILDRQTAFNGVVVTVRVHYMNQITGEWDFHDGIGAIELQTQKGASPAELDKINKGAISMAFPIAKTLAIKDACDMFGSLFGANLNRRDIAPFKVDESLKPEESKEDVLNEIKEALNG